MTRRATTRYSYSVPNDLTDPPALAHIFSQREYPLPLNTLSGLLQHEVIILKSCFDPTSHIESDAELEEYKAAYTIIHQRMRQHPEKLFILLTQPPLNPAETDPEQAHHARRWRAGWPRMSSRVIYPTWLFSTYSTGWL